MSKKTRVTIAIAITDETLKSLIQKLDVKKQEICYMNPEIVRSQKRLYSLYSIIRFIIIYLLLIFII